MPKEDGDTRHPKDKECPSVRLEAPAIDYRSNYGQRPRVACPIKFVNAVVLVGEQERHGGPKESDRRRWHDGLSSQEYRIPQTE